MSNLRDMIAMAAKGNAVGFRSSFETNMNTVMADRISFKDNTAPATPTLANESVEPENEVVLENMDTEKKEDLKKAFNAGKEAASEEDKDEEEKDDTSDLYIFDSSEQTLKKAKEIVANYNKGHESDRLEARVFEGNKMTRFFVSGSKVGRLQVKNLLKGVGGKLQS